MERIVRLHIEKLPEGVEGGPGSKCLKMTSRFAVAVRKMRASGLQNGLRRWPSGPIWLVWL